MSTTADRFPMDPVPVLDAHARDALLWVGLENGRGVFLLERSGTGACGFSLDADALRELLRRVEQVTVQVELGDRT